LDTPENIQAKQTLLKRRLRGKGLKLNWTDPEMTRLETLLARGDRRLGRVIHRAWQLGARFDAWDEHFRPQAWWSALEEAGLDPDFYTRRPRPIDEVFPWDHINVAVRKKYLAQDYAMSQQGETRVDCRERCFACGILPAFATVRSQTPPGAWECPEVKPKTERHKHAIPLTPIGEGIGHG
jgi:hypothetical protein